MRRHKIKGSYAKGSYAPLNTTMSQEHSDEWTILMPMSRAIPGHWQHKLRTSASSLCLGSAFRPPRLRPPPASSVSNLNKPQPRNRRNSAGSLKAKVSVLGEEPVDDARRHGRPSR